MSFPITANIDDSLKVEVHLHQFYLGDRDRYCWTYITRGMDQHQQPEMCLSLLVDDGGDESDFPRTPIKMFELLAERTRSGRKVAAGDSTRLGRKGIFGFPCLFFVPSIQYKRLPSLDNHLALVLVHQEEYEYVRQYGLTRFLSRLGKFCSSFPYPSWNTPARPSLFPSSNREVSILSDASHVLADYSYAHQMGRVLQMQLHRYDAGDILTTLSTLDINEVAVINTAFSPRCDASLYWQKGQDKPGAYAAPEATSGVIGGSFISMGFADSADLTIEEDGFSVTLVEDAWDALCDAIRNEQSWEGDFPDGQRFILDYVDVAARPKARAYNPVAVWRNLDDPVVEAEEPVETAAQPGAVVRSGELVNLSGPVSLAERVEKADLFDYIDRIESTLNDAMSEETESFQLDLALRIAPRNVTIQISSNIDLNPEFSAYIADTVKAIKPCSVTSQIQVRIPFSINNYSINA